MNRGEQCVRQGQKEINLIQESKRPMLKTVNKMNDFLGNFKFEKNKCFTTRVTSSPHV